MIEKNIIDFLSESKLPTAAVSDALGKTGVIADVQPICQPPLYAVGPSYVVHAVNKSNWYMHEKMQRTPKGSIVFVQCQGCEEYAALGELVSKYCIQHMHAAAVVINGLVRDVINIRQLPVWAKKITPLGCFNAKPQLTDDHKEAMQSAEEDYKGIMVCDDSV